MLSGEIAPNINILVFAIHLTWHLHKCPLMSHFKLEYRQAALSTDWKRNVGVVWVRYKATKSIIQSVPHWSLWSKAVGTPLVSNHQVWSICSLWLRQTFQGYLTSKRMIPYQVYLLVLPYRHSVKKKATTHNLLCELYGSNGQRYSTYTLRLKQSSQGMAKWVRGHRVLCIHITARLTNPGGYLRVPPSLYKGEGKQEHLRILHWRSSSHKSSLYQVFSPAQDSF